VARVFITGSTDDHARQDRFLDVCRRHSGIPFPEA
jgi:hypothetical protein